MTVRVFLICSLIGAVLIGSAFPDTSFFQRFVVLLLWNAVSMLLAIEHKRGVFSSAATREQPK